MRIIIGVAMFGLASCGSADVTAPAAHSSESVAMLRDRISELESAIEDARDRAQQAEDAAAQVESAISDIRSTAGRFQYDDWQNVVPAVTASIGQAESEAAEVLDATSQVTQALDR